MTIVPAGPDPAVLVTDDAVAAAQAADGDVIHRWTGGLPDARVRRMLEAAAGPVVAAWQHWEEDQHFGALGEPCSRCGGSGTEPRPF